MRVHKSLLLEIQDSVYHRSAQNLYQIFITFKERFAFFLKYGVYSTANAVSTYRREMFCRDRLLIYGKYCSQVETAIALLDYMCKDKEDVRMKLEVGRTPPFQCGGGKVSRRGPAAGGGGKRSIGSFALDLFHTAAGVLIILCPPPPCRNVQREQTMASSR